ncbi:MAG: response regulator [Aggregatilineales bacterium]
MTTWMVVEDEPDLYEMVLAMYETMGINGVAFLNGEDAVDWLDDVDAGVVDANLPQLALLDIRLPGAISGTQIGARIRASQRLGHIPIVLMTAYRLTPTQMDEALKEAGADLLIYKPLPTIDEFQRLMFDVLTRR